MSESTERTRAPRPMFSGTLHLPSRSAPNPELPKAPTPSAAQGGDRIARRVADLAECRRRFPVLFDVARPVPLAIGIHKPLGRLIGVQRAKFLLEWWTSWPAYVAAVAAGGRRHSLDGSDAGEITEEQRSIAVRLQEARALGQEGKRGAAGAPARADQPIT